MALFPVSTYLGTDTSCLTDLSTIDILISGSNMLAQRLLRRLTTPAGAMNLIDPDPNAGISFDLNQLINRAYTSQDQITDQQQISTVCQADQEVLDCSVQITPPKQDRILKISIVITTAQGPFSLTIGVDQLNAQILYEVNG